MKDRDLDSEIRQYLSRQLTLRIMANGETQEEFATRADIPKSVMSSYCTGQTIPYPKRLHEIALCLRCEIQELLPSYERP